MRSVIITSLLVLDCSFSLSTEVGMQYTRSALSPCAYRDQTQIGLSSDAGVVAQLCPWALALSVQLGPLFQVSLLTYVP